MVTSKEWAFDHRQIWRMGLGIAAIYVPIRIYMNVIPITREIAVHRLPLWFMELLIGISFFSLWIYVIEFLHIQGARRLGSRYFGETRLPGQLVTLLAAIVLAVFFNMAFVIIWHCMESLWEGRNIDLFALSFDRIPAARTRSNNSITILALMAAYYLASNQRSHLRVQQLTINEERLEKENIRAHFTALKNQVSPHFLFNNFSVLSSLIEIDPALSIKFVGQLSKAYRYILEKSSFDTIELGTEVEFIETYMFLLRMRFQDRVLLEINLSQKALTDYLIVPLALQILVENAIKHNEMSLEQALSIQIYQDNDYLVVSNPLQPRAASESSTKLGLRNIVRRYGLLTAVPVVISDTDGLFTVKLPLLT